MNPSDLAKEVGAFNMLRDRPSPLALVVGYVGPCLCYVVTAPVEKGRQIFRVNNPTRFSVDYDYTI